MKKLCLIVSLSMVVILAFAAFTWASESSVFDNVEGILIRACTNEYQVSAPPYSAFLDVRDSTGALMPVGTFTVYDISTGLPVLFPVTQNPFLVYSDLTNPTVSLTLDSDSGAAYLFRTNSGVDVTKYAITNLANGHCAAATNGQTLTTQPSGTALCDTGTASSVTTTTTGWTWTCTGTTSTSAKICSNAPATTCTADVNCGTGNTCISNSNPPKTVNCSATSAAITGVCGSNGTFTTLSSASSGLCANSGSQVKGFTATGTGWQWTCGGINGGADSSQCSASLQTYTVTASATGGSGSISPSGLISAYYNTTKSFTITAPSGYTATVGGTCGGSPATGTGTFSYATGQITNNCSVSATFALTPVNGICGTANGGTFLTLSSASSGLCQSGFSVINFTGTGPWYWNCQGLYGGNNSPQCNANLQTAPPDLAITSAVGPGVVSSSGSFTVKVTINNHGAGAAGPFNVTVYLGYSWFNPLVGASAIGTVRVNGLAAGQSTTVTVPTSPSVVLHTTYVLTVVADSSQETGDPNTADNMSEQFLYVL